MLQTHSDRSVHLVCLLPDREERKPRYTVPGNVVGIEHVYLQDIPAGARPWPGDHRLFRRMEHGITALMEAGQLEDLALRSEEHTSELQSLMRISYAVFCLKKKNNKQ